MGNRQNIAHHSRLLGCWLAGLLLVISAHVQAQSTPPSPFEFSVSADDQTSAGRGNIMKLKRTNTGSNIVIGEVLVWWTTRQGKRISIPMKQFSDDLWINRVTLGSEAGQGRLDVIVIAPAENGAVTKLWEQNYELELPQMKLKFLGQADTAKPAEAPIKAASAAPMKKVSWSLPEVAILVGIFNLILIIPALFFIKTVRRVLHLTRQQAKKPERVVEKADPAINRILENGGLINRTDALPKDVEVASKPVEPAVHDELEQVSTDELFEMVEGAVARLEQEKEKVPDENKQQFKAVHKKGPPSEENVPNIEKPKKPAEVLMVTTIEGSAAGKIDLNDLSF